jgi:hypothetical protein
VRRRVDDIVWSERCQWIGKSLIRSITMSYERNGDGANAVVRTSRIVKYFMMQWIWSHPL